MADLPAAARFLESTARVLERRVFDHRFEGADPGPVLHALKAYRNDDGGFGHALEPDIRDPASQPIPTQSYGLTAGSRPTSRPATRTRPAPR